MFRVPCVTRISQPLAQSTRLITSSWVSIDYAIYIICARTSWSKTKQIYFLVWCIENFIAIVAAVLLFQIGFDLVVVVLGCYSIPLVKHTRLSKEWLESRRLTYKCCNVGILGVRSTHTALQPSHSSLVSQANVRLVSDDSARSAERFHR